MMTLLIVMAVGFIILVIFAAMWANDNVAKNTAVLLESSTALAERFGEGDYHLSLPGPCLIGIVWDREQLILGDDVASAVAIPLGEVRDASIKINGVEVTTSHSTTSTKQGSQLAGGLIGGVLLGPVGAVIGGVSGSNTTTGKSVGERKIKSVKLVIRVADRKAPLRTYTFYDVVYGEGHEASSPIVKPSLEKASHFHALLTQVIEDREATATRST